MKTISRYTLDNGVRVLLERIPGSSTARHWRMGQRGQPRRNTRTKRRHALHRTYSLQGHKHARGFSIWPGISTRWAVISTPFTSPEFLCIHANAISEDLPTAVEILAEMLLDSQFPEDEIEHERGVILEEIAECEDAPEELCRGAFLPGHVARSPSGTGRSRGRKKASRVLNRKTMLDYWKHNCTPDRILVTIAGGVDRRRALALVRKHFDGIESAAGDTQPRLAPVASPHTISRTRDLEQIHFCFGVEGPPRANVDRFALAVFNTIFGGGMGSRLSNEIRERRGIGLFDFERLSRFSGWRMLRDPGAAQANRISLKLLNLRSKKSN